MNHMMTNANNESPAVVGYHIGCHAPVLRMPHTGREICRDCGVTPSFIARVFGVQWCGDSIVVYCPVERRDVKTFSTKRKDFLARALKWAADNGVKLENVRDGKVWL